MVKTKKLKERKNQEVDRINKILKSGLRSFDVKKKIFEQSTPKEIYQNFKSIHKSFHFSDSVNLTEGKSGNEMYLGTLPYTSLSKNLAWCIGLIESNSEKIQFFLERKEIIEKYILKEDWTKSLETIEEIDNYCGVSIWSVITRASIKNLGKIEDKSELNLEFGDLTKNNFLSYILFYTNGYFTDEEIYFTSITTHSNDIKRSANALVKDFFIYRFFDLDMKSNVNLEAIFNIERSSSIIDIFQLITSTLEYLIVCNKEFSEYFSYEIKHVLKTLDIVSYPHNRNLKNIFEIELCLSNDKDEIDIIDFYTAGEYEKVLSNLGTMSKNHYSFCLIEIMAKSYSRSNKKLDDCFLSKLITNMSNVMERNCEYAKSLEWLACISNSLRTIDWFKQLRHFVDRESANTSHIHRKNCEKGIHLYSEIDTPKKSILYKDETKIKYLTLLSENSPSSPSIKLALKNEMLIDSISTDYISHHIDSSRYKKFEAEKLIKDGSYRKAETILLSLLSDSDKLIKIEALRDLVKLYTLQNNHSKALATVVDFSIADNNFFSIFDTRELLSPIEYSLKAISSIDLPIAYALHSQYVDDCYESNLKYSFENFLCLNGYVLPTELFGKESKFGENKLNYFLRWVCTTEVMKLYLNFETARQIEECRLEICNYLLDKVSDNQDLQFEIKQINKNLIIRKAVRQVENSRIYVDSAVFKGRRSTPYRSLFERFLELESKSKMYSDDLSLDRIHQIISKDQKHKPKDYWKSLSLVHLPDLKLSPKNATFLSLAKLIREEFTFGEKGINNYLSTRIRHGVLPTAIRKSSLLEGIYASEQSKLEDYQENLNKQANLTVINSDVEILWKTAKNFTKKLENEISNLNDKRLQIYTLEGAAETKMKAEAIFNYSITPLETYAIQKELPLSPTYDDFLKVVVDWLWFRTDFILDEVKKFISSKFTEQLNNIFESYRQDIQSSNISRPAKHSFTNAIRRAKNNLHKDLAIVCTWFEHVDSEGDEIFEFSTAIEIAKRSLSINPIVSEKYELQIQQKYVSYWVDIFFILFDNAISKSNLEKSDLSITVNVEKLENEIIITVSNNTRAVNDYLNENRKLKFYKEAYDNENLIRDVIQSEGGTGFFKLWKIMKRDLNIKHFIEFGYISNNTFSVSITIQNIKEIEQ
ncbi:hypothetical protein ACNPKB_12950 [Shewanella marisflavi]|uniref:hypothetical protein n=1 Tax=Shewanella marisflavi TaxID=260364 RepID=UPI003AAD299B